jgi:hypothetical protein
MAKKSKGQARPPKLRVDAASFVPYMRELRDLFPSVVHSIKHSPNTDATNRLAETFYDAAQRVADCPLVVQGRETRFADGLQRIIESGSAKKDPFENVSSAGGDSPDLWSLPGFKEAGLIQIGNSDQFLRDVLPVFQDQSTQYISVNEPLGSGEDDPCYLRGRNSWWMWLVGAHYEAETWTTCDGKLQAYPKLRVEAFIWGTCSGMWAGPERQKTAYNTSRVKVSWNVWGTVAGQLFSKHEVCVTTYTSGCVQLKIC